jgi:hypothetical protein
VREAADDALIISNGFSCREQIMQMTDRQALHAADVLKMAMDAKSADVPGAHPEFAVMPNIRREAQTCVKRGALTFGILALGAVAALTRRRSGS